MDPVNFKEANLTLTAAKGEEGKVRSIRALVSFYDPETGKHYRAGRVKDENSVQTWALLEEKPPGAEVCLCFRTVWQPTEQDLATLGAGGPLVIQTLGAHFPPMLPSAIAPGFFTEKQDEPEQPEQ